MPEEASLDVRGGRGRLEEGGWGFFRWRVLEWSLLKERKFRCCLSVHSDFFYAKRLAGSPSCSVSSNLFRNVFFCERNFPDRRTQVTAYTSIL